MLTPQYCKSSTSGAEGARPSEGVLRRQMDRVDEDYWNDDEAETEYGRLAGTIEVPADRMGVTFGRKGSSPLRWSRRKDYTHIKAKGCFSSSRGGNCPFIARA